jgi:segregation and condensation protein A
MEISEIPIAQITHEYLEYIDILQELNLEIAGEFLVMAASLMQIKAKMLLPSKEEEEAEGPNPLEELKSKLLEYQKYKEVARQLSQREEAFSELYYRPAPVFEKDDYVLDVSLFDLLNTFRNVLKELPKDVKEIVYEEIPIEQRIREILDMFEGQDYLAFEDILKKETTRIGMILSFLAVLELIRLKQIIAKQVDTFGALRVYRVKEEDETLEESIPAPVQVQDGPQQEELNLKVSEKNATPKEVAVPVKSSIEQADIPPQQAETPAVVDMQPEQDIVQHEVPPQMDETSTSETITSTQGLEQQNITPQQEEMPPARLDSAKQAVDLPPEQNNESEPV